MLAIYLMFAAACTLALYILPERWLVPVMIAEMGAVLQMPPWSGLIGFAIVILQYLNFRQGAFSSSHKRHSPLAKALKANPVATVMAIAGKSPRGALVSLSGALPTMVAFCPELQAAISSNPVGEMEALIKQSEKADELTAVFNMQPGENDMVAAVVIGELSKKGQEATKIMTAVMGISLLLFSMLPTPALAFLKLAAMLK